MFFSFFFSLVFFTLKIVPGKRVKQLHRVFFEFCLGPAIFQKRYGKKNKQKQAARQNRAAGGPTTPPLWNSYLPQPLAQVRNLFGVELRDGGSKDRNCSSTRKGSERAETKNILARSLRIAVRPRQNKNDSCSRKGTPPLGTAADVLNRKQRLLTEN